MRKAILASLLLAVALVAYGQHGKSQIGGKAATKSTAKPKPKPSPSPKTATSKSYTDPCGVYYSDFGDMVDELNLPDK